jgi:hypothetical protein
MRGMFRSIAVAFGALLATMTVTTAETTKIGLLSLIAFSDLAGDPAEPAINSMVAQGILHPVSPTQFAPHEPLTRGDFVIAIQHMFNLPREAKPINFTDISPGTPLYAALQAVEPYLGRQTLCFGCALGTNFMPDQPITRANVTFTVTRVLTEQKKLQLLTPAEVDSVLERIPDADQLSAPSRAYFATAIKSGISPLGPENRIEPASPVTRSESAVLLDNVQRKFEIPRVHSLP